MQNIKSWLMFAALLFVAPLMALAAEPTADNMQIVREKIQADRKLFVAANMDLTDAESGKFWPIYDRYMTDLKQVNERLGKLIQDYAKTFNENTLTDDKAKTLTDEMLAIQDAEVKMMRTYATELGAVLPGKKLARFLQIENKIRAVLKYELAGMVPFVQ